MHAPVCAAGFSRMVGVDVRSGALVANWIIPVGDPFGGPLAVDPLSSAAFATIESTGSAPWGVCVYLCAGVCV